MKQLKLGDRVHEVGACGLWPDGTVVAMRGRLVGDRNQYEEIGVRWDGDPETAWFSPRELFVLPECS